MRSKRLDHLSISGYLQMNLTGLTPLLHRHVVWKFCQKFVGPAYNFGPVTFKEFRQKAQVNSTRTSLEGKEWTQTEFFFESTSEQLKKTAKHRHLGGEQIDRERIQGHCPPP
jgi:hypothetical protein